MHQPLQPLVQGRQGRAWRRSWPQAGTAGRRQGLPARCSPCSGDAARRGRRERKAPKCQQQMKGVGKFNLPTFSTNVTFGFSPDKLSAPEVSFFCLFYFSFFFFSLLLSSGW